MKVKKVFIDIGGFLLCIIRIPYFFFIRPLLMFLLKDELDFERKRYDSLLKDYHKHKKDMSDIEESNSLFVDNRHRMKEILHRYQGYDSKLCFTEHGEMVIIFFNQEGSDNRYLYGMDGSHEKYDAKIELSRDSKEIKIHWLESETKRRGYAKILLEHTIRKAKAEGVAKLYGDLSSRDEDSFVWLVPFYESLGFMCVLPGPNEMCGSIELILNEDALIQNYSINLQSLK